MNKKISYLKNPRHKVNKAPILMTTVSWIKRPRVCSICNGPYQYVKHQLTTSWICIGNQGHLRGWEDAEVDLIPRRANCCQLCWILSQWCLRDLCQSHKQCKCLKKNQVHSTWHWNVHSEARQVPIRGAWRRCSRHEPHIRCDFLSTKLCWLWWPYYVHNWGELVQAAS